MMRRVLLLAVAGIVLANTLGCSGGPKDVPVTDTNKPIVADGPSGAGAKTKSAAAK
jgi:hypothetical protein